MSVEIDCDFPGGNILVDAVNGDTIAVRQDLRDTNREWFYWYFRMHGAAGRSVTVNLTGSPALGLRGPAVSPDAGRTWEWLGADVVVGSGFQYHVPAGIDDVRFSFGMPYVGSDLDRFLGLHSGSRHLQVSELCQSEQGRSVELLRLGQLDKVADYRILLTARHHSCEMMASYVLEGVMRAVLANSATGRWLREHAEIVMVPFVDKDGVE